MVVSYTQKHKTKSKKSGDLASIRRSRTPESFIKKLISPYNLGWKDQNGMTQVPTNEIIADYNKYGRVRRACWGHVELTGHFLPTTNYTMFFAGDGRKTTPYCLANIDIDIQKKLKLGSTEGAIAFVKRLQEIWPDLYWEMSTNGRGIHGYLIVDKRRYDARETNAALKSLQNYLRSLAVDYDIEAVEVKGTCPIVEYGVWGEKRIESIQHGQLAKFPREYERFQEWKKTTCVTVRELLKLEPQINQVDNIKLITTSNEYTGSCSGIPFNDELLKRYKSEDLTELAERWLGKYGIAAAKRSLVRPKDMALSMAIIVHCTQDRNKDGSIPQARVEAIWNVARSTGLTDKSWDHHVFTAARNWLEAHGYLVIEDFGYTPGYNQGGEYVKGQAARWAASEYLIDLVLGSTSSEDDVICSLQEREDSPLGGIYTPTTYVTKKSLVEHPKTPSEFAIKCGIQTHQAPFYRPPVSIKKRA
jgi:hypothetical protein